MTGRETHCRAGGRFRGVTFALVVAAFMALAIAAGAQARGSKPVKGVVVHHNTGAGSFVVADKKGHLIAVHSTSSPSLGSKVTVSVRKLANGTFAATKTRAGGRHGKVVRVRVHGTVSHASGGAFTLSGKGVSMLVKSRAGHTAPPTGAIVTVSGTVDEEDEGQLDEEDLQEEGEDENGVQLEGTILEVNEAERTLKISADDDASSGEAITVHVPAQFDISMYNMGEEVELNVKSLEDGSFELVGSASDDGEEGAEDHEEEQGEQGEDDNEEQGGNDSQPLSHR